MTWTKGSTLTIFLHRNPHYHSKQERGGEFFAQQAAAIDQAMARFMDLHKSIEKKSRKASDRARQLIHAFGQ